MAFHAPFFSMYPHRPSDIFTFGSDYSPLPALELPVFPLNKHAGPNQVTVNTH